VSKQPKYTLEERKAMYAAFWKILVSNKPIDGTPTKPDVGDEELLDNDDQRNCDVAKDDEAQ
jgi:hypothetical protein